MHTETTKQSSHAVTATRFIRASLHYVWVELGFGLVENAELGPSIASCGHVPGQNCSTGEGRDEAND